MELSLEQKKEVAAARNNITETSRPSAPGMEAWLHTPLPVLDHGFVRTVDYMGNDEAIVQAARVSYGKGTKHGSSNEGLIRYLMRHHHSTPFEMCEIKLHVKLPVFVARQWIRHRTAKVNEISARYSILDREFYFPEPEHLAKQSSQNNQGRGEVLDHTSAQEVLALLRQDAMQSYDSYEYLIDEDRSGIGLARELARMNLPTNIYTQWYWKTDLHNLFNFLRLRSDPHAQFEIRCYAQAIAEMVKDWVPLAYQAFKDYRQNAVTFSAQEMEVLREILDRSGQGELSDGEIHGSTGLSAREARDFVKKLQPA